MISNFLQTKIMEKYIVKDIFRMKKEMEYADIINEHNGDWGELSFNVELTEDFIRTFQDKVEWEGISFFQKLSEEFIQEFEDKIDWETLFLNQDLSYDFHVLNEEKQYV